MVDFKKLVSKKRSVEVKDFIKLFDSLDRQASHTELRPTQIQALQLLSSNRSEKDIVLKISTGAGKTTVALLWLQSHMGEKERPTVYLCPTNQLVEQVQKEATKLGIASVIYPANESRPHVDGAGGNAIIICSYDKLFNAKTTFDRTDVKLRPCAIVLDDAHAGVEEIRQAFTLSISSRDALYGELLNFLTIYEEYNQSNWQQLKLGDPRVILEVPYWIWFECYKKFLKKLSEEYSEENRSLIFVWPYLRDILRWCRCVVSARGIEIVPDIMPVYKSAAFAETPHRLFMSATLADDSVLIRELDCDPIAASKPLIPDADKGLGERMVLAPCLVDKKLDREWVMRLCQTASKKYRVVVLSASEKSAKEWEKYGAKVFLGENVSKAVNALKDSSSDLKFAVFPQRYDGVDLPDDACRILVLDGIPYGEGLTDKFDSSLTSNAGGTRNRLVYRIEQGMGRAVRSHADYAAIILAGEELPNFIARPDVQAAMNSDTRAQIKLALELVNASKEESDEESSKVVVDLLSQCLKRDPYWKDFYNEKVRNTAKSIVIDNSIALKMASAERTAFNHVIGNDIRKACEILGDAISKNIKIDKEKAFFLQRLANYRFEIHPGEGLEIQQSAFEKDRGVFCPPVTVKRPSSDDKNKVCLSIIRLFEKYENPNDLIAAIQKLKALISYDSDHKVIEEQFKFIGSLIGAESSRQAPPGPDILWLWPDFAVIIEAKNENQKTLHKRDSEQMLASLLWFDTKYPIYSERRAPLFVARVREGDSGIQFSENARVILPDHAISLISNIEKFYQELVNNPAMLEVKKINSLLNTFKLSANDILKSCSRSVRIKQ